MLQNILLTILVLFSGWVCINLSSAFIFHYQSNALLGYIFPGTSTVFKLGWSLEFYTKRLFNQNLVFFLEFSEVLSINDTKIQELRFEIGHPIVGIPTPTEEPSHNTPNNNNNNP